MDPHGTIRYASSSTDPDELARFDGFVMGAGEALDVEREAVEAQVAKMVEAAGETSARDVVDRLRARQAHDRAVLAGAHRRAERPR